MIRCSYDLLVTKFNIFGLLILQHMMVLFEPCFPYSVVIRIVTKILLIYHFQSSWTISTHPFPS